MDLTLAAKASENALHPCAGKPIFPLMNCLIAVLPDSAFTIKGSARNTPVKNGRRTRS